MNKALLATDIPSEIGKGIDPNVARNAMAYRNAFGRYTLSVISIMEVVCGLQKKQSDRRLQRAAIVGYRRKVHSGRTGSLHRLA